MHEGRFLYLYSFRCKNVLRSHDTTGNSEKDRILDRYAVDDVAQVTFGLTWLVERLGIGRSARRPPQDCLGLKPPMIFCRFDSLDVFPISG